MKLDVFRSTVIVLLVTTVIAACAPQTPATPTVDVIGTTAAQLAAEMLTQTAGAVTPTPIPPTETATPAFTDTPSAPTEKPQINPPRLIAQTGCWTGPGDSYTLISNIELNQQGRKNVIILGIGSEPGWIVIRNPYFNNPCWVKLESMEIDPNMDMTQFPVMTPGP
ncbi:MAG: hypothetical protein HYU84_17210 [Chloroflexi bacterium]|nr:hypothetical protein [Chloroflexota bacterium]MBI3170791.1 hypothetical protein [Chloroflexota bacterium]